MSDTTPNRAGTVFDVPMPWKPEQSAAVKWAGKGLYEALRELMEAHAREIDVPLEECVAGPFAKARAALLKATGGKT